MLKNVATTIHSNGRGIITVSGTYKGTFLSFRNPKDFWVKLIKNGNPVLSFKTISHVKKVIGPDF